MSFSNLLITWYLENKRDLPWRDTNDPYKIWLSEIILQQTRVDQGLSYYKAFVDAFSNVNELAKAEENQVLKLWQGLGYYSRARNLHATAKVISEDFNGVFPDDYKEILSLRGIGPYTAAAISSFAFKMSYPVVDGNVYRVLSRVFQIHIPIQTSESLKYFTSLANELIDESQPDLFNQGIMELGALLCSPKNPKCNICPLNSICLSFKHNTQMQYPVKKQKNTVKKRFFNYLVLVDVITDKIYLEKRIAKDVWQHLYQFKLVESIEEVLLDRSDISKVLGIASNKINSLNLYQGQSLIHKLTHQHLNIKFWMVKGAFGSICAYDLDNLSMLPFPKPIFEFLEKCDFE